MSAFIVDRATIHAIVHAAMSERDFGYAVKDSRAQFGFRHVKPTSDELGELLTRANVASVQYRYPGDNSDELPGPINCEWADPYAFPLYDSMRWPRPEPGFVLKQIACLDYQSCERPDWRESEAYAALEALTHAMIARVSGYESAPWGCSTYPVRSAVAA